MSMRLYVNVDHVATVREARKTDEPDPVAAAVLAEIGGADGITVHLREDRRHIQDRDVRLLMQTVRSAVNLELAASSEIVDLACQLQPLQATLVPEKRAEVTTEGGLALSDDRQRSAVGAAVERLRAAGIRTALFIDPEEDAIRASLDLGTDAVELHTGEFANAAPARRAGQVDRLAKAVALASGLGLAVHAGHGLTYRNVTAVAALSRVEELNIGHSIVSRALLVGFETAVRQMVDLVRRARAGA
jgi:pyridoxine 5-phosphate synthase